MNNKLKIYNYNIFSLIMLVIAVLYWSFVGTLIFLIPDLKVGYSIFSILGIIFAIFFIVIFFHMKNNPPLATTENTIIIDRGPFTKHLIINISNIDKIERKSATRMVIWYRNTNNILKKERLMFLNLNGNDQIEFNKYINKVENNLTPAA